MKAQHRFYRNMSLDLFLRSVPPGSLDLIDEDRTLLRGDYVIADVRVETEAPGVLETTFCRGDTPVLQRRWNLMGGLPAGPRRAVFIVPGDVDRAETRQVDSREAS